MNSNRTGWHWFSTSLGVNTAIVIFNAILISVLWNAVFGLVQTEREDAVRAAIVRNDNIAIAFEQYAIRTIESADAVIQRLIGAYVTSGRTMGLDKFVADFTISDKAIIGVVLVDERGIGKTSAYLGDSVKPINVADREHFKVHILHDSGKVFVGKPVVGRITGKAVIPVTRRINKADGTFGGVAMALIEPGRFTDVLHDAKLRPLDNIALVGMDGITRARLTGSTESWGQDIHKSPLFAEQARRPNGNYFARGQLDGVARFFSYRTIPEYQVMATVGTAETDVMAEFYRRRTQYFWAGGLTSLIIAGFAALLMLALARQRVASFKVARGQARFLATFNQAAVGIAHSGADGRYLVVNQKLCEILGYSKEELLARTFTDVTHPDDVTSSAEFRKTIGVKPGDADIIEREKRYIRKDGTVVWCNITASAVHDDNGNIEYYAAVIQDISDRKLTEFRIQHLSRVNAVLSGINTAIVHVRNRHALFNEACRIAVEVGHFPFAWIGVLDEATQDVTPAAWAGEYAEELTRVKSSALEESPRGQGAVGRAIRERRPIVNNDILPDHVGGPRQQETVRLGFHSLVTLPLYEGQAVVGTLTMYARERQFFDEQELILLSELAANISFAVENIETQESLDKLARIREVSSEINAAIVRIREREILLRETCRIASEHGKFEMVWIGEIDSDKQQVQPTAWRGFSDEAVRAMNWDKIRDAGGTLSEAIQTGKASVRNNIETGLPGGRLRAEALARGCRSSVCLPLVAVEKVVGLIVLFAIERGFFDKDELALLDEVAGNISFALENIEKNEKIDHLSRIQAVMGSINALIVRVNERDELFRGACNIAVEKGGFRMALIAMVDRDLMGIVPVATAGKDEALLTAIKGALASSKGATNTMVAQAVREKKAIVSNDSQSDPRVLFARQYAESGVRSMAVLPLIVADEAVGVLALYSEEAGFFDEEEFKLLAELSGDIAFAIDHLGKQEKIDYLAYYDVLTGLANRSLFLERVAQYMRSAVSGGHKLAIGLIDLERFKNINDSLGQPAGDALLKQVAEWLTRKLGDANLVARVEADHFAVVLPEVKSDGNLARLIETLMAAFLEHPFHLNDEVFRIAVKVGVALCPDDGADADTLFRNAEAALKKAKASGEKYLFHTRQMTAMVAGKLTLENQLRQALDKEEFVLHYQPKVNLASGRITSAEALIRWNDPRTGLVPPGRFIPILEETGLIYEVGRWALKKAIEDYLRWRAAGLPAVRIAVNVSPLQLRNRGFVAEIEQKIGIDVHAAAGLELEITESLIMEDVKHNIASLEAIRAMGVTIAIDDFGTGFSSLSYLAKLPVDTLKIDRSFIIDMTVASEGLALVSTVINLAHSLKLKVVAEGVETDEQSRLLRLLSCDEMQGYLFSKPVPAEIFETNFLVLPTAA